MKLNIIKRYSVSQGRRKYQSPSFCQDAWPRAGAGLLTRDPGNQADAREGVTAFLEKRAPQWPLSKVKDYPPML